MPFLPLYIRELGVTDDGDIALWAGLALGVTPAVAALCGPLWGRVGDRFGNKILVQRSLLSFVVVMSRDGVRDRGRGTCSRCAPCRGSSAGTAR